MVTWFAITRLLHYHCRHKLDINRVEWEIHAGQPAEHGKTGKSVAMEVCDQSLSFRINSQQKERPDSSKLWANLHMCTVAHNLVTQAPTSSHLTSHLTSHHIQTVHFKGNGFCWLFILSLWPSSLVPVLSHSLPLLLFQTLLSPLRKLWHPMMET